MSDLVTTLVTVLLSGGVFAAIATLITSRAVARKSNSETKAIDAKTPVEVDSIAVQGADMAVLTMSRALESATSRIDQLEREREEDRRRIRDLEDKVEELRGKVETAEAALADARQTGAQLTAELASFVQERARRHP